MTDQLTLDPVSAAIAGSGLVAVLRAPTSAGFSAVADVLVAAGVTALEVTLTSGGALEAIAGLRRQLPGTVVVGAGTVLTEEEAKAAVGAGAAFLVSPVGGLGPQPVPLYPGAFSPSEIYTAHRSGAPLIKLFPAGGLGPGYLKDLRGPLPDVRVMPTGGIGLDDIATWLGAGAVAVGVGGPLIGDAATGGSLTALARRARHAVDAVTYARS